MTVTARRILFVTNRYPSARDPSNAPNIVQQAVALRQLGHHVDVLHFDTEQKKAAYASGVLRMLLAQARTYDLVHAHYGFYCCLVARMQWRFPLVVTYRGSDVLTARERPVSQWVARHSDGAIVMTEQMKQLLGRADAQVIPYGIDTDTFRPEPKAAARQKLGLDADAPLVLFPYDPKRTVKRFDLIEQAVALLKPDFPNIQTLIIANKTHQELAAYMSASDVTALASDTEGSPIAVREAMACNLPVVSVDVGDVKQLIGTIEGCHIVERNAPALAAGMAHVLRRNQRAESRAAAISLNLQNTAQRVANVYENVLASAAQRNHPHKAAGANVEVKP